MLRLVTWWKIFHREVYLLPLIAFCNYNPQVICAMMWVIIPVHSTWGRFVKCERQWTPSKGFTKKIVVVKYQTKRSGGMRPTERRKLISGNSLVVIYSSAGKVSPGNKYWSGYIKSFLFRSFFSRISPSSILENKFDSSMFVLYVRGKKTAFEIEILPTGKI